MLRSSLFRSRFVFPSAAVARSLALFTLVMFSLPAYANRDDVAVVIGNRDYSRAGAPNVDYAVNDAEEMKDFLIERLGYQKENIIFNKDVTLGEMQLIFGDSADEKGKLWNWAPIGRTNSRVFVYYSGHGAPDSQGKAYLIPVDVDPNQAAKGYSIEQLEKNLMKLKQHLGNNTEVILMLDACFAGQSARGSLLKGSLGMKFNPAPALPGIIRFSASGPADIANWDTTRKMGVFTSRFLDAVDGAADKKPNGNENGLTDWHEMRNYINYEVSNFSRRTFNRNQAPDLPDENGPSWEFKAGEKDGRRISRACREEPERWMELKKKGNDIGIREAQTSFLCPTIKNEVAAWLKIADEKTKIVSPSIQTPTPIANPPELTPSSPTLRAPGNCIVGVAENDVLWVRAGPGTSFKKVGAIPPNSCGIVVFWNECQKRWCHVNFQGINGWANSAYIN